MPIKKSKNPKQIQKDIRAYFKSLPRIVGVMSVEHFKRNFAHQGFYDDSLRRWRPRRPGAKLNQGRSILMKTGRGRRSVRILRVVPGMVVVGTDLDYMSIHNTGGIIKRQVAVRTHERKAHDRTWMGKKQRVEKTIVFRHQRNMNLFIPKRQFVGNSKHLFRRINQRVIIDLRKIQ